MTTHLTSKGQIVIPANIRRELGMRAGTPIQVKLDEKTRQIVLTPITREHIERLRGIYKGKKLLVALLEEKRREREL